MIQSSMFMGGLMALLIQAENVSGRIFEARGYFGSIAANFLHDYAPFRSHFIDRRGRAVDHDVNQQTDFSHGFSMQDPGALTSPRPSSKATLPSPRVRMFQPKMLW